MTLCYARIAMFDSLSHHAYAIVGREESTLPALLQALKKSIGFSSKGNPDYWYGMHEVLGISEARLIKEASGRQPLNGGKKIFVIVVQSITGEAQNALLKVFEEPSPDTHFFLLLPSAHILLPTLRSRLEIIKPTTVTLGASPSVKTFTQSSVPNRLELVKKLLKEMEEGTREIAVDFLDALECEYARQGSEAYRETLSNILLCKRYLRDRSPSFKLILEHLAVTIPRV